MPDPFIDVQDVVDYLGRGTITDPGMLIAIDSACDICRTIAEQDFNAGTATISLDGNGGDCLVLPHFPVGTVSGTITVNGEDVTEFMVTDNGLLLRGTAGGNPRSTWPLGRQNVSLTYSHGYTEVPRDVRMVALSIASRLIIQGPALEESLGDVRVKYSTAAMDLTKNEERILKKYRRTRSF